MATLTRRVQVLFSPQEYEELEALARARGTSIGALVREAVAAFCPQADATERLQVVKRLAALQLPVASWEQMERESMRGCDVA